MMREIVLEILADLPMAMFTAAAVGMFLAMIAKIAEIHLRPEHGELDRGYNKAVRDIAAKIRQLTAPRRV